MFGAMLWSFLHQTPQKPPAGTDLANLARATDLTTSPRGDFLEKPLPHSQVLGAEAASTQIGTPGYLAPEAGGGGEVGGLGGEKRDRAG